MRIHILGIGGVFMTGVALLAKGLGHRVEGTDTNIYSPTKEILEEYKIPIYQGYKVAHLSKKPDLVLVGNVVSRGNPMIEHVLAEDIPFKSGPEWLAKEVLRKRWVMAISGTHGKTTATALLAWIMDCTGHKPGFLIGGSPLDFDVPARLGENPFFIIEADEYDTAFFDKRPKFMHYRPLTLAINNLEFDHSDIYAGIGEIQKQFHYLLRTVPSTGRVIAAADSKPLQEVLDQGCWSDLEYFRTSSGDKKKSASKDCWTAHMLNSDGGRYELLAPDGQARKLSWQMMGGHNVSNALAAAACARHAGVAMDDISRALESFSGVRRRLQLLGEVDGICVYEDFAHHPTAIAHTLEAIRMHVGTRRVVAVIELRSSTMRTGTHQDRLKDATSLADRVLWRKPDDLSWNLEEAVGGSGTSVHASVDDMLACLMKDLSSGDYVIVMSNGGFERLPHRLLESLQEAVV
jgi:UDP-N-acetylmuramate: L-alanyl-gamma-D-glutamyl-meso-diaminopimelate ligase